MKKPAISSKRNEPEIFHGILKADAIIDNIIAGGGSRFSDRKKAL